MTTTPQSVANSIIAKLPPPDLQRLQSLTPPVYTVKQGTSMGRLYGSSGAHPSKWNDFRYWGPTGSRFDHHLPNQRGQGIVQARGIMYSAIDNMAAQTCFAEYFQTSRYSVSLRRNAPCFGVFKVTRDIQLLDLTGAFVTQMGASTAIHSGPRQLSQAWAQAFYQVYTQLEGILYCSSMNGNAPAIALFRILSR